jgi:hypothetical protein
MSAPFSFSKIKTGDFSKMLVSAYNMQRHSPEDYHMNGNKTQKRDLTTREFKFWLGNQES